MSQQTFGEITVSDEQIKDTPPTSRVKSTPHDVEAFQDAFEVGTRFWLSGTEYCIVDVPPTIFSLPSPRVITEDGNSGQLAYGALEEGSSIAGVMWRRDVPEKAEGETEPDVSIGDLIAQLEDVYVLESPDDSIPRSWIEPTTERKCPHCKDRDGTPLDLNDDTDERTIDELRWCTNCNKVFRIEKRLSTAPATILVNEGEKIKTQTISGIYRRVEQDDFKLAFRTADGRDDGLISAQEVATFVNSKTVPYPYHTLATDDPDYGEIRKHLADELVPERARELVDQWCACDPPSLPAQLPEDNGLSNPLSQSEQRLLDLLMQIIDGLSWENILYLLDHEPFGEVGYDTDGYSGYRVRAYKYDYAERDSPAVYWHDDEYDTKMRIVHFDVTDSILSD